MKNLLAILFLLGAAVSAFAQGTVRFSNDSSDLASPPDRFVRYDATAANVNPAYTAGSRVFSNGTPGLRAQLYYGASTANESSLVAVTTAPSTFKNSTSASVGSWFSGGRTLDGFPNSSDGNIVNLQVRVWDINLASSYEAATALGAAYTGLIGQSLIFTYTIPTDPLGSLDLFNMKNFQGFTIGLPVPEPSTIALLLVGSGIFFVSAKWRRHGKLMKNFFAIVFLLGTSVSGFAQGTVRFSNDTSDVPSPPDRFVRFDVTASSLNPASTAGARVFSNGTPGLRAQLYFGASTAEASSLTAVSTAPTTFKNSTSASVGTWFGGTRTLDGFTNGTVNLQVRVWDISLASSFEAASALGAAYTGLVGWSMVFQYTIPTDPLAPLSAYNMNNFQGFGFGLIPEPSTVAILLLSCGILFVQSKSRRRRD